MFEERTKLPVEKIVVLIANEEGTPQVFVRDKSKYIASLEERIEKYWNPK